jgi:hypothetical protein
MKGQEDTRGKIAIGDAQPGTPEMVQQDRNSACPPTSQPVLCSKLIGDREKYIHVPKDHAESPKSILKRPDVGSDGMDSLLKEPGSKSELVKRREKYIHEPSSQHHETKSILKNNKYARREVSPLIVQKGPHFSARRLVSVDEQDRNVLLSRNEKAEAMKSISLRHMKIGGDQERHANEKLQESPLSPHKLNSVDEQDADKRKKPEFAMVESLRKLMRSTDLSSRRHIWKARNVPSVGDDTESAATTNTHPRAWKGIGKILKNKANNAPPVAEGVARMGQKK